MFVHLAFYLLLFGVCSGAIASSDTWWHLATGRWIVEHQAVPHSDPFSFATDGKRWVAHEYLTDVLMYSSYRAGGMLLLATENALLLTLAFAIVAKIARVPFAISSVACLVAAYAARPAFALRPQSISLLFGAAFLWIAMKGIRDHQPRWFLALPALKLLWVQLHAGYLLGLLLIALVLLGELVDRAVSREESTPRDSISLAVAGLACIAVVPLNPNGFTMLEFPFFVMRMKINSTIQEWRPVNWQDPHLIPFFLLALLTLLAMLFSRNRYRPGRFILFAVLLAAALRSARNIPVFCIVAAFLLAENLGHLNFDEITSQMTPLIRTVAASSVLLVSAVFCARSAANGLAFQAMAERNLFPQQAVTYLSQHHLRPNVLNDYAYGGYMIWRLFPEYRVYVDGRADLYGDNFLAEYVEIYNGQRDPRPFLDKNGIETVLLAPKCGLATLLRMLTATRAWSVAYEDEKAVVFVRSSLTR